MSAILSIPAGGTSLDKVKQGNTPDFTVLPVRVNDATLVSNDFNHADSLELSCAYVDSGIDPRFLHAAQCTFFMGQASILGDWNPTRDNARFAGILTRARRRMDDGGASVHLSFQDYTALFLETHNYPLATGVPSFNMTISQAWAMICDNTGVPQTDGSIYSTVSALRTSISFSLNAQDVQLGVAVLPRFRKFGKPQIKPGSDAWGVWQQIIQSLGLISYIHLDECKVTTALDYYTNNNPPMMIWGQNIAELEEERNTTFARKGIRVVSYDPITNTTSEANYPPDGDVRIKNKPAVALPVKAKHAAAPTPPKIVVSERETFQYPSVTSQDRLDVIAQRIYEERSRQEFEGHLKTVDMTAYTASNPQWDMLGLKSGDSISITYEQQNKLTLKNFGATGQSVDALIARGYSKEIAVLMVKNMREILTLPSQYFVKSVTTHFAIDEHSGSFDMMINYCNRINIDGSA